MKGLKIRTMTTPIHLEVFEALGANPTPMAFSELFSALQQGVVDGQENPLMNIYANKLHEVQKYLTWMDMYLPLSHLSSPRIGMINWNHPTSRF